MNTTADDREQQKGLKEAGYTEGQNVAIESGQQKAAIVELIAPVVVSFVAILLTTLVLFMIDSYLARRTAGDG
jgi:hypothetical protein